jgi:homoserine dehydrogenase
LITESTFTDKQFFKGKGAGAFPIAAVLSNIAALKYEYKYEYKNLQPDNNPRPAHDYYLKVYVGADDICKIDETAFEWIEERCNDHHYNIAVGVSIPKNYSTIIGGKKKGHHLFYSMNPL